jgi:hypothetical protein
MKTLEITRNATPLFAVIAAAAAIPSADSTPTRRSLRP